MMADNLMDNGSATIDFILQVVGEQIGLVANQHGTRTLAGLQIPSNELGYFFRRMNGVHMQADTVVLQDVVAANDVLVDRGCGGWSLGDGGVGG